MWNFPLKSCQKLGQVWRRLCQPSWLVLFKLQLHNIFHNETLFGLCILFSVCNSTQISQIGPLIHLYDLLKVLQPILFQIGLENWYDLILMLLALENYEIAQDHSQDQVKDKKGPQKHDKIIEEQGEPRRSCIHHVVHKLAPAFKGQSLEDCHEGFHNVVESRGVVSD